MNDNIILYEIKEAISKLQNWIYFLYLCVKISTRQKRVL